MLCTVLDAKDTVVNTCTYFLFTFLKNGEARERDYKQVHKKRGNIISDKEWDEENETSDVAWRRGTLNYMVRPEYHRTRWSCKKRG